MRRPIIKFWISLFVQGIDYAIPIFFIFLFFSSVGCRPSYSGSTEPAFIFVEEGSELIVDYSKYGDFFNIDTDRYRYKIKDTLARKALASAVGAGIFPNRSVYQAPRYKALLKEGKLDGSHWDFLNIDNKELSFYKWATAPEDPGVKQFYTAMIMEQAGLIKQAIKGYYACVVHFPRSVGWTYWHTPWYVGPKAIDQIESLTQKHPDLGIKLVDAYIKVKNRFDNDVSNDSFKINPGRLIRVKRKRIIPKKVNLKRLNIVKEIGNGKIRLVKYENGHWQLLVDDKPFIIKALTYNSTEIGQSPDEGTLADWMLQDNNKNGKPDGPYDSWVDKNRNNIRDPEEKAVGDFQLMKDMGCNTIRLYHHASNKELLRDLYENYGIMVMMGDMVGMYTIGSGASWDQGTDYTNSAQKKNMFDSVKKMVNEFKDEPYILMWVLGNENNYGGVFGYFGGVGNAAKYPHQYYSFINEIAEWIHSVDPVHPVAICNGDILFLDIVSQECPDVDIFGCNSYRGPSGFGRENLWGPVKEIYGKPVIITEYGCPAYHEGKPYKIGEREQAEYHLGNWQDIYYNSASYGEGNALGGVIFSWMDEWWKSGQPPTDTPFVHEPKGQWKGPFPSGWSYEEWYGLVGQGDGTHSPYLRHLRESYYMYKKIWTQEMKDPLFAGGRGVSGPENIWFFDGTEWSDGSPLNDCTEIFSLIEDKNGNIWVGGSYYGIGKVWKYNGKRWDNGTALRNCTNVYVIYEDPDGNIWAGGSGKSKVWRYDGKRWDNGVGLDTCAIVYALGTDKNGNLWAGGLGTVTRDLWKYDGRVWDKGIALNGCKEIYSIETDVKGNLFCGGIGRFNIWRYDGTSWNNGENLKDSQGVYVLSRDQEGNIWAGGSGKKKFWIYDGNSWNEGENLDGCIAVYALSPDYEGNMWIGGWSLSRRGRVWKREGKNWVGKDLKGSFIIRDFAPTVLKK